MALVAPGDLGVFHASNYHAASNDIHTMSLAVYVAFVNWGGLRRLCAIQNYWAGSDDWVNTGDMMEQRIIASKLPALRSQLGSLRRAHGYGQTWLTHACKALGEGTTDATTARLSAGSSSRSSATRGSTHVVTTPTTVRWTARQTGSSTSSRRPSARPSARRGRS